VETTKPEYQDGKPSHDAAHQRFLDESKNHTHMMAIYFMHYNFVRIHQTLKVSPAIAAGVTSKLWEEADMVAVLQTFENRSDA
jgi:hypothetical protein